MLLKVKFIMYGNKSNLKFNKLMNFTKKFFVVDLKAFWNIIANWCKSNFHDIQTGKYNSMVIIILFYT